MKELFNVENIKKVTNIMDQVNKDDKRFGKVKPYQTGGRLGDKSNSFIDLIVDFFIKK